VKILQISSATSFGGGERYVVDLTNSLVEKGHQLWVALRPNSPLARHLNVSPDRIMVVPLRNALDAPSARELARIVKNNEIEVVHAHMARDYSLAAYAAHRSTSTKFVVTRHVLFRLNSLHRRTLSRALRVIAVSEAVARELRSHELVSEQQIAVVPNGVRVDRYERARQNFDRAAFLKSKNLPINCLVVGSIGELRTLKRHDDFIRACARVKESLPDTQFVIAGIDTSKTGEVRKQLKQLVTEVGLTNQFYFLGWLDDADQLLCAMDVFVSASETESFGLVIAEAMAARTAVVATKTDGACEVLEDQKTGLLVPIGDVNEMAAKITALLKDETGRQHIASNAQKAVKERFSLTRMVDQIEAIYQLPNVHV